jgi:hypothetical protein
MCPGFLSGAGFPEELFNGFSGAPAVIRTMLEQPHLTFAYTLWSRISRRAFFTDFLVLQQK